MNKKYFQLVIMPLFLVVSSCSTDGVSDQSEKHTHHYVVEEGYAATCIEDGLTNKVYCDGCGYVIADHTVIEKLGHVVVRTNKTDSGVNIHGHNEYDYCERCGTLFSQKEEYPLIKNKHELCSITNDDGSIDFEQILHRQDVDYHMIINVSHNDINEKFEQDNKNTFKYPKMDNDTLYRFSFDVLYEDGDYENTIAVTRYINTVEDTIPSVNIETKNGEWTSCLRAKAAEGCWGETQTENEYVYCYLNVKDADGTLLYESSNTEETKYDNGRIKSRGNTSSFKEYPSYKIKLSETSDLLKGILGTRSDKKYNDKNWLLLNNNSYNTQLGFLLNSYLSGENKINAYWVNVYMNGDYRGVYLLSESVKQGKGSGNKQSRVKVDDDGFIVENDAYWWKEDKYFDTPLVNQQTRYTFTHPDEDDVTKEQINYIKNYITQFETALLKDDESYSDYSDINSFASWLLTHELLGTKDGAGSNVYITKKDSADSKLKMGPCWDFDSNFATNSNEHCIQAWIHTLYFGRLLTKNSFVEAIRDKFDDTKDDVVTQINDYFNSLPKEDIYNAYQIHSNRWGVVPETVDHYINRSTGYINQRIAWFNEAV